MKELLKTGVYDSTLFFQNAKKTPERIATFYEIELYISGEGSSVVDGIAYPHQHGRLLFAKPGMKRYSLNRFLCYSLHLHLREETAALFSGIPATFMVSDFELYARRYREIIQLYDAKNYRPFLMQSKIYALFDMILEDSNRKAQQKKTGPKIPPEQLQNAIKFIEDNYWRNITLKDIASHISFSPTYFHNAFSAYTGKTPHDYLLETRLEAAKVHQSSSMTITVRMAGRMRSILPAP